MAVQDITDMTTKNTGLAVQQANTSIIAQFSDEDRDIIKNSVAKGTTDAEFKYFLALAASSKLNPFTKEIWCYKDNKGNLLVFSGRDGYQANAQRQSDYRGLRSAAVYENDEFEMDIPAGHVKHKIKAVGRGAVVGAYCFVYRDGFKDFIVWVDINTYDKKAFTWESHKAAMIEKVAEAHCLKKAYNLGGSINTAEDYDFQRNSFSSQTEDADYTEIKPPTEEQMAEEIVNAIADAKTLDELTLIFNDNTVLHGNKDFIKAMGERKQVIKKAEKEAAKQS